MGGSATLVILGVALRDFPDRKSIPDISHLRYGDSLAKPDALTLYRFSFGQSYSSVYSPTQYCSPPADVETAANAAEEKVVQRQKLMPPQFRTEKIQKALIAKAREAAATGSSMWVVKPGLPCHQNADEAGGAAAGAGDNCDHDDSSLKRAREVEQQNDDDDDDEKDEDEWENKRTIIGYLFSCITKTAAIRMDDSFFQKLKEAKEHWAKDPFCSQLCVPPELVIIGGH